MRQRIVDQDTHDLGHPLGVAIGLDRAARQAQLEVRVVLGERRRELRRDRAGEVSDVGRLGAQLERAGLELRQVEKLQGQLLQPLGLLADLAEELLALLLFELLVLQQLDEPGKREDRRAQLVGGRRDEALARGVELGELALHVVERLCQLAELVLRVGRDRLREVAGGHLLGRLLEALDPARERAGDEEAGQHGEGHRHDAGQRDAPPDQRDRVLHVVEGCRVHDDARDLPAEEQRLRGLAEPPAARRLRPRVRAPAAGRGLGDPGGELVEIYLRGRVGDGIGLDALGPARHPEEGHPHVGAVGGPADGPVDMALVHVGADRPHELGGVLARRVGQPLELLLAQVDLELRHDVEVDAGERRQRDGEEQQREAVLDRARPRHDRPSACRSYLSSSRKR